MADRPWYRRLFGPVSISGDYRPIARDVMLAYLARRHALTTPVPLEPRAPVVPHPDAEALVAAGGIEDVGRLDRLVRELEGGRGVPVLLRQYLRLSGRIAAFSRDRAFADAVDGLIVVDLLDMPAAHLERYCGREGADRIRRFHGRGCRMLTDRGQLCAHPPGPASAVA